jgi:uncharacterized repeat protein (TIGR01451 family)
MSFLDKFWRLSVVALVAAVPFVAACSDDDGAAPPTQDPPPVTGTISGSVTNGADQSAIIGALVGTSPATATALSDAAGNFVITNVPIGSYAVTATASGFASASVSVTLSSTAPTATATLVLAPQVGPPDPTMGDLNVLVTNRNGEPQSSADVSVEGTASASATTDANGFALFTDLAEGAYTVTATKTISGIDFRASGGTNIAGGETSFLQLTLVRDFGQSVFPNIDGEAVTLDDSADIFFVPVPGNDSDPLIDCNIIRSQHMFIAEVEDASGHAVSGVKVQWDLNISSQQTPAINTGSIVDSDDPDLDPGTARSGLSPAFNVDTRKAVTFTNDNDQTIAFNNTNVVVGAGQTWIIITSPVEGITDVIAATPDIPASDPECANNSPDACDKEIAIKRWVNWDTSVALIVWDPATSDGDPNGTGSDAVFTSVSDGATITNVLARSEPACVDVLPDAGVQCELLGNRDNWYMEVTPLRLDSPFAAFNNGFVKFQVIDDVPDIELGQDGLPFVENGADGGTPTTEEDDSSIVDDLFTGEWDFCNDGGSGICTDPDLIGWNIVATRLAVSDAADFYCVDIGNPAGVLGPDGICDPGNSASPDTFSTAYQQLLDGNADDENSFTVTWCDEFDEECTTLDFMKEWVASRVEIIKNIPGQTIETVDGKDVKHHTVQIGQSFSYTITVINDGDFQSPFVRITDTLPRFGVQFSMPDVPGNRNGGQAFAYVTDRPTFDPVAVIYAIDDDDDAPGVGIDRCIRGDDGSLVGNAYVEPALCTGVGTTDVGTVASARTLAEGESSDGHQVVWIQWFDEEILGRQQPGGGIQTEDTVEVTLIADESLVDIDPADPNVNGYGGQLPDEWCNIATVTDGDGNRNGPGQDVGGVPHAPNLPLTTESLDADTLCHEVVEALLDVRKTTVDAVLGAGALATWTVEVENNGSATLLNTVVHDTLDQALFDAASADGGVFRVIVDDAFGGAILEPTSRFFTVDLNGLAPTSGFVDAYTVEITTPGRRTSPA